MVVLSLSVPKFNQWFGPVLLRYSIRARYLLSRRGIIRDNPYLDAFCGIPVALKLIQLEVYHECKALETNMNTAVSEGVTDSSSTLSQKLQIKHRTEALTKQRIDVLEKYIRPALVPNNTWSDIRIWQFHYRLLKWLRTEYLIAKYRPTIRQMLYPTTTITDPTSSTGNHTASLTIRKSPQLTKDFFNLQHQHKENPWTSFMSSFRSLLGMKQNNIDSTATDRIPFVLPTTATLTKVFDMTDWEVQQKNLKATRHNMELVIQKIGGTILEIRGGSIGIAHVPVRDPTTINIATLSLEEIMEVTGGHVMQCNAFNALCEDANIYQFWTKEYIESLGRYLLHRSAAALQQTDDNNRKETVILDVGAGDGLLAQLLREFMGNESKNIHTTTQISQKKSKSNPFQSRRGKTKLPQRTISTNTSVVTTSRNGYTIPTIIASDNGAWGISPIAPVLKQTVEEALAPYLTSTTSSSQYHVIVLCSWMPMNTDWTSIFRQNHGVDEYILIGECDDGQCGDNWETWGNKQHLYDDVGVTADDNDINNNNNNTVITPQYVLDGYIRCDLNEMTPYQFSRFDCRTSKMGRTVSFRKATTTKIDP